jgi:putative ABC transporter-associated repeat protein
VAALLAVAFPAAAWAEDEDPNLGQSLAPDAGVAAGERVLTAGHVDLGPKFAVGNWTLLVLDDAAKADPGGTSVWRRPADTVIHVLDQAKLTVPDDPAYQFVGAAAGEAVWVVPQTQNPDVVWLGWNTQDPEVMERIDRGVTLSLTGAEGPGAVTVYLQSGAFGEPQLLWDSRVGGPQPVWVDVNTHTHANWVFTEPGVHLIELTAEADLIDGTHVTDSQVIRFAVGTGADPAAALTASWPDGSASAGPGAAGASGVSGSSGTDGSPGGLSGSGSGSGSDRLAGFLIGAIALVSVVLVAAAVSAVARGQRAKRRALGSGRGPASPDGAATAGTDTASGGPGETSGAGAGEP